jgi:hypothetical protein
MALWEESMGDCRRFELLLETAGLIARHVDYPGKRQVVERCREEIQDLTSTGQLSAAQNEALRGVLQGMGDRRSL